jgi:hypothetical protein
VPSEVLVATLAGREVLRRIQRSSRGSASRARASALPQTRGHPCARGPGQPPSRPRRGSNCCRDPEDAYPTTQASTDERRPQRALSGDRDAGDQRPRPQSKREPTALLARNGREPLPPSAPPEGTGPDTRKAAPEIRIAPARSPHWSAAWPKTSRPQYTPAPSGLLLHLSAHHSAQGTLQCLPPQAERVADHRHGAERLTRVRPRMGSYRGRCLGGQVGIW